MCLKRAALDRLSRVRAALPALWLVAQCARDNPSLSSGRFADEPTDSAMRAMRNAFKPLDPTVHPSVRHALRRSF